MLPNKFVSGSNFCDDMPSPSYLRHSSSSKQVELFGNAQNAHMADAAGIKFLNLQPGWNPTPTARLPLPNFGLPPAALQLPPAARSPLAVWVLPVVWLPPAARPCNPDSSSSACFPDGDGEAAISSEVRGGGRPRGLASERCGRRRQARLF